MKRHYKSLPNVTVISPPIPAAVKASRDYKHDHTSKTHSHHYSKKGTRSFNQPHTNHEMKRAMSTAAKLVGQQDFLRNSVFMFTDGSCLGNRNVASTVCPAGWGLVAVKFREDAVAELSSKLPPSLNVGDPAAVVSYLTESKCDVVAELCGPIRVNSGPAIDVNSEDVPFENLEPFVDVGKCGPVL